MFIGLTEVAGYFNNLAKGLGELGISTQYVDLDQHPFGYGETGHGDRLVNLHLRLWKRRARAQSGRRLPRLWWAMLQKTCLLAILCRAAITCDVFVFSSGSTFFRYRELPILKRLGKRIIVVFTGSDHRPPFVNGVLMTSLDDKTIAACGELTRQIKDRLLTIERHADVIVGHHLCAQLHERPFVPILLLGIPFATRTDRPVATDTRASGTTRIVHAPSRPREKGSFEIRKAIEALRAEGLALDYVELVKVPNETVLDELARCDFIIDELYSDTRMAVLATEAAFFGKPAVVGGFALDVHLAIDGVYPPSEFPPVQYCQPDELESAIRRLVVDVPYRLELGQRARDFVATAWTPKAVAERFLALMTGEFPEAWLFDPSRIRYVSGVGLPEAVAREGVRRFIELRGLPALCLSDKPELERAFVAFGDGAVGAGAEAQAEDVA